MNKGYFVTERLENKAKKIEKLLEEYSNNKIVDKKILDIGTGNGGIAFYFSKTGNSVSAVDVHDSIQNEYRESLNFRLVRDENLPFEDKSFDIVISNHIIEHTPNQSLHLREINRVLRDKGECYLSMPNRLFPYEVHTKTIFIHYLTNKMFYGILKAIGKFSEPLYLLTGAKAKVMLKSTGFTWEEQTAKVLRRPKDYYMNGFHLYVPNIFSVFSPTRIFILQKRTADYV